jgi:hypothetical protein
MNKHDDQVPPYEDSASAVDPSRLESKAGTDPALTAEALRAGDHSSIGGEDVLAMNDLDPALDLKMHLVNNVRQLHPFSWRIPFEPSSCCLDSYVDSCSC